MNIEKLVERLLKGEAIAAARLISLVENTDLNEKIVNLITPYLGNAYIIGITGAPGVGKSTLTDKLVRELRSQSKKVGVIAVDIAVTEYRRRILAINPSPVIRGITGITVNNDEPVHYRPIRPDHHMVGVVIVVQKGTDIPG